METKPEQKQEAVKEAPEGGAGSETAHLTHEGPRTIALRVKPVDLWAKSRFQKRHC